MFQVHSPDVHTHCTTATQHRFAPLTHRQWIMRVSHPSPEPSAVIIFHISGFEPYPGVRMVKIGASGEAHAKWIVTVNCLLIGRAAEFDSSGAEWAADGR